ncbi:E3 ubiquitin-protein ligase makorin-1, partial [Biomphalaria glabrata]
NISEPFQVNSAAVLTENESKVDNLEVYPVNDSLECARRCPFEHGPVCHLCHTHRLDRDDPDLHLK